MSITLYSVINFCENVFMPQTQDTLYPKLSSVYNKLLQLAIAIVLLTVVLKLWLYCYNLYQDSTNKQFKHTTHQFLSQLTIATNVISFKQRDKLVELAEQTVQIPWIKNVAIMDETGQVLVSTENYQSVVENYNERHGSEEKGDFVPFILPIKPLSAESSDGYIRLIVNRELMTKQQRADGEHQYTVVRIMLLLAGVIGFFLTRGLNRFSRQGYRIK